MLTLKKVNNALKAKGYKAELARAESKGYTYFYFYGPDAEHMFESSVSVSRLNALTLEQWVEEFESKRKTGGR